jgi:septal ring factor EnvC (AmiA/AmiB activator)
MLKKGTVEPLLDEGTKLTAKLLEEIDFNEVDMTTLKVQNKAASERIRRLIDAAKERIERSARRPRSRSTRSSSPTSCRRAWSSW